MILAAFTEPPFQMAQVAALLLFIFLGIRAAMKFRTGAPRAV